MSVKDYIDRLPEEGRVIVGGGRPVHLRGAAIDGVSGILMGAHGAALCSEIW